MLRHFTRDESGIAMGLAVIVVVIVGVMGAGLLVFVRNDLEAVVEVNQGQRAFEMADAGIAAAELQLNSEPDPSYYDDSADSVQWARTEGGMTLEGLYSVSAANEATITIEPESGDTFEVVSTGVYGNAKRKIEAVFGSSEEESGIPPAYYAPNGNLKVEDDNTIDSVSMFAGENLVLENYFEDDGDGPEVKGKDKKLVDWEKPPWNTEPRRDSGGDGNRVEEAGFGAEGVICGDDVDCTDSDVSSEDGIFYDSTTDIQFLKKEPPTAENETDTITYPFSQKEIDVEKLEETAEAGERYLDGADEPDWDELFPNSRNSREAPVVFVDLQEDEGVTFENQSGGRRQGILVVRCGKLVMEQNFQGVIILLEGGCGGEAGLYESDGADVKGYVYSDREAPGDDTAISVTSDSKMSPLPDGKEFLLYEANIAAGFSTVKLQSWRELYE